MDKAKTSNTNALGSSPIFKLMLKYAIPSVISLVVNSLYNIVDQIFIGQSVGYLGNAATNVILPLTVVTLAFSLMIGDGAASYMSLKLGEGYKEKAARGVASSITMLLTVSAVFIIFFSIFLKPLVNLFGATPETFKYSMDYGRIIVLGFPFVIISTGLNTTIRADGSPHIAMISMLSGALLNIALDAVFMLVFKWGVAGAAAATIIAQFISMVICLWYLPRYKNISMKARDLKPDFKTCRTICAYGISSFITQMSFTVVIAVMNNLLVKYGAQTEYGKNIPLAALGIVMKVNMILVSFVVGIGVGAQPIMGYNYGAKNMARVKRAYFTALIAAVIVSAIGFIMFQFFPQPLISLFGNENALYNEFAQKSFRIFLMLCILNGFQQVSGIFFQAIGKPLKACIITLSRQILALLPALLILPIFLGLDGVLWAGPVADGTAFIFTLIFVIIEIYKISKAAKQQKSAAQTFESTEKFAGDVVLEELLADTVSEEFCTADAIAEEEKRVPDSAVKNKKSKRDI